MMSDARRKSVPSARSWIVSAVVVATASVVAGGAALWSDRGAGSVYRPASVEAVAGASTTTSAATPVVQIASRRPAARDDLRRSVTAESAIGVPERPPADPYADVPVVKVGTIEIPRIGLVHPVYEGIWLTVIDHGPGHWPGTAMPGQPGNTVFPGHRTTHSHPFRWLDRLAPGDEVIFRVDDAVHTYHVTSTEIVSPKALWVVDQTDEPTMTLIACHPPGSARERIVVKGELASP
jgi:sortase A